MLESLQANWPLKLLALGLAFAIWISVSSENRIVQDFTIPLEILLPDELTLATVQPTTATVRLAGPETSIRNLDPVPIAVRVDLGEGAAGQHDVLLSRANLTGVPRGLDLEFIHPDRLTLTVDRRVRQQLPVEPIFLGEPPEGYVFYGAEVRPDNLTVEGPASEVQSLDVLRTNPIRLDLRTSPFTIPVAAVPESPHVRVVDTRTVAVRVLVDTTPMNRTIEGIAVEVVGQAYEAVASPETISATLAGPPSLVEGLRPEALRAIVDASGMLPRARSYQAPLRLDFLEVTVEDRARISILSLSKGQVAVRIFDRKLQP